MGDWVALLRGINVGRAKRIAMTELRAVYESLGCTDVATLLNSGNVVFRAAEGERATAPDPVRFREAVREATGVDSEVVLRDAAAFRRVADTNPLRAAGREPKRLSIAFAAEDLDPARAMVIDAGSLGDEELVIAPDAVYQWLPDGVLASRVPPGFWASLGTTVTARNDQTVQKIVALLAQRAG
jgi:uncharacterized protein (DUF1697 family)